MNRFVLRTGSIGQEVRRLQGCLRITADGEFGNKTEAALKAWQAVNGLTSDGIAGKITQTTMGIEVLPGIDVSGHNGEVDWSQVAAAGFKFAWIKCSEATTLKIKSRKRNFKEARKAGLIVGGYHFGRPDTYSNLGMNDAKNEAENFMAAIGDIQPGDLLPVLDVEAGIKTDDNYNAEWALTWLRQVEAVTGVRPMVYCAKWATNLYLRDADSAMKEALATYPIWWASYNMGVEPKRGVRIWNEWDVWQWTGSGSVPGIKGKCDQNWCSGGQLDRLRAK